MNDSPPSSVCGRLERQNLWEPSDVGSEEMPSILPTYIHNLFTCVSPDANLDLENEEEVTQFIANHNAKRDQTDMVNRIVGLMQLQNVLKVSTVFDAVEIRLVTSAMEELLRHLPPPEKERMMTLARQNRKKQILAELVDSSLLDPSSQLFNSLIRHI